MPFLVFTHSGVINIYPSHLQNCTLLDPCLRWVISHIYSEDAVEHDELDIFLRRNDEWDPLIDEDRPMPAVKPVGVPGAVTPLEMTPEPLRRKILAGSPAASTMKGKKVIPVNRRTDEIEVGDDLGDHGLQGVRVTRDELRALIEELGLGGDDAGDLARGLSGLTISAKDKSSKDTTLNVSKENNPEVKEGESVGHPVTVSGYSKEAALAQPDVTNTTTETDKVVGVISEGGSIENKSLTE